MLLYRSEKHPRSQGHTQVLHHHYHHMDKSAEQLFAAAAAKQTPTGIQVPAAVVPAVAPAPQQQLQPGTAPQPPPQPASQPAATPPLPPPGTPAQPPPPSEIVPSPPHPEPDCRGLRRVPIKFGYFLAVEPTGRSFTESALLSTGGWELNVIEFMEDAARKLEATGAKLSKLRYYDVGCNMAYYSFWAAKRGFGEVHCFEPMRENLRKIYCALSYNDKSISSRIHVHPYAAGPQKLSCVIYSPPENPNDGKLQCNNPKAPAGWERVEIRRVDSLVSHAPDVMKMDVEGYEPGAVEGMTSFLPNATTPPWSPNSGGPAFIFTEFCVPMMRHHGADPHKFLWGWNERGYVVTKSADHVCGPCHAPTDFPRMLARPNIDNIVMARPPFADKGSVRPRHR
eukprot:TRINITY_DN2277_c0_g2_i2.p1 TRINITY_DN2277_c0_g2~~TRINITY_DN2277_c0_g2_i2.p1  ORF type:complete len:437 (+),score=94.31 TRINITY_DN2277_c0_g2_i2:125-1312(+)